MSKLDAMQLFISVVDTGSFAGGARETGLSLSSVSRHITALETRLGVKLLIRTTRSLALTEAGRVYLEKSKRLLADIDDMEANLNADAAAPVGRLQVTGPTLFGRVYLLPLLARFLGKHPMVTLDVTLQDRPVHLIDEGIDVAIIIGDLEDSTLAARRLGAIKWVVSGAPSYLASKGVPASIQDLQHHDCLVYSQQSVGDEWMVFDGKRTLKIKVPVRMRSNTLDGVISAALEGVGLVYAPAWAVASYIEEGRLVPLLRNNELPARTINAVFTHSRMMTGKVRALLDFLAHELEQFDFADIPEGAVRKAIE